MSVATNALDASVWYFAGQVDPSASVRQFPIKTLPFTIGRTSDASLTIGSPCVSKQHAEVVQSNGNLWLRDLKSTNGTYVNGKQVTDSVLLEEGDLVQFATVVFRLGRDKQDSETCTIQQNACDQAMVMIQFDKLMSENAVVPYFQPIVSLDDQSHHGYEILCRSRLFGLNTPADMFAAAAQLNQEGEFSRLCRRVGIKVGNQLPSETMLFANTHPIELSERGLAESLQDIRRKYPQRPITLEIHEAAVTDTQTIRELQAVLSDLDMRLAYDDFGAGQARLVELSEVRADYLKFDMKLIQGIHRAPASRQQLVESLVRVVSEMGIAPLAEGIEAEGEHEACKQIGFRLCQGFYYGKPGPITKYGPPDSKELRP